MYNELKKYITPLYAWPSNERVLHPSERKTVGRVLSMAERCPALSVALSTLSFMFLPDWAIDALFRLLEPAQSLKLIWVYAFEAYLELDKMGQEDFAKRFAITLWVTTFLWIITLFLTTTILVAVTLAERNTPGYVDPRRLVAFSCSTTLWVIFSLSLFWLGFDYFSLDGVSLSKPFPKSIVSFPLFAIGPIFVSFMTGPWVLFITKACMYWASSSPRD